MGLSLTWLQVLDGFDAGAINTGFGGNGDLVIPPQRLAEHQANLLTFLSAGVGDRVAVRYVRAAQLLTLLALVRGWSAVRPEVAIALVKHINHRIVPDVPKYGSVGASGDLIPSSYIAAALCGRGNVRHDDAETTAEAAVRSQNIEPLSLHAKEGLALVNGTRMMTAVAALTVSDFEKSFRAAVGAVALVVEALAASSEHFDARIHQVKDHPGPIAVAAYLRALLGGSMRPSQSKAERGASRDHNADNGVIELPEVVQEVYSLRCAPQILGVVLESLRSARDVLEREATSANDNPLIDPERGDILHGGNFMGQHVSRTMDALKLDLTFVANHMHALTALLMDKRFSRGLPNSLSPTLGISQGFKGLQISQTSLVAQIRYESAPSSIHTLPTEQFNQDFVSLGLHAAQSAAKMEAKVRNVVAMTLLSACQALDLRGRMPDSVTGIGRLFRSIRALSKPLAADRALDIEIAIISDSIVAGRLDLPELALANSPPSR